MRVRDYQILCDRMIVDYLIKSGLRKVVAYTDKTFLIKTDMNEYRQGTKDETVEILKTILDGMSHNSDKIYI